VRAGGQADRRTALFTTVKVELALAAAVRRRRYRSYYYLRAGLLYGSVFYLLASVVV